MSGVTLLLEAIRHGEDGGTDDLLSLVYSALRNLAAAKMPGELPRQTLQATALLHEAWLRLGEQRFGNRAHFFAAADEAMRRILVAAARRRDATRRGGGQVWMLLHEVEIAAPVPEDELLAVNEALERLALDDQPKKELVKLRYFAGLIIEEAAAASGDQ